MKKPKKNKSDRALDLLADFLTKEFPKWMREDYLPTVRRRDKHSREFMERQFNIKYED